MLTIKTPSDKQVILEANPDQSHTLQWKTDGIWHKIHTQLLPLYLERLIIEESIPYEAFLYFLKDCIDAKAIISEKGLLKLLEYYHSETGVSLSLSFLLGNYRERIAALFGSR
jgi:hypothetical protein